MHARTGNRLVGVHQVFPFAEGVQRHGHGAHVQGVTTNPQQMIEDTGHFIEHGADVLAPLRHLYAEQLFGGQAVGVLVAHHGHVVETVHIRNGLHPGARLGQLLGSAVQEADMRIGTLDNFAVQLQNHPQNAVRRRVLRAEVEGEITNISHGRHPRKCLRAQCAECFHAVRW